MIMPNPKPLLCLLIALAFALPAMDGKLLADELPKLTTRNDATQTPKVYATSATDELPKLTTLSDATVLYTVPAKPYAVLRCDGIEVVVVNNEAVDDKVLPGHRAGYSGVASLTAAQRPDNLFVPGIAGLNFEHIHDGTVQDRQVLFEPREAPMELRVVDQQTVELYQAPTPHWQLESCQRYRLLDDGIIELTLECIAHGRTFKNGYIGLFWANYIHQPESLDIHFRGHPDGTNEPPRWIQGSTPRHGELSTHIGVDDERVFAHDANFPLTLVFNRSGYRFTEPWYYGVSHDMAYVQLFRSRDNIRLAQSPSGGGDRNVNPAWDFQYFIPDYQVGQRYQMVMRAMYVPFESAEQIARLAERHRPDAK